MECADVVGYRVVVFVECCSFDGGFVVPDGSCCAAGSWVLVALCLFESGDYGWVVGLDVFELFGHFVEGCLCEFEFLCWVHGLFAFAEVGGDPCGGVFD